VRVLDRKLVRELYRSKGLLLLIAGIVAIGIMCFVSMQSAYLNLNAARQQYYRQCRMADFWVDLKKVPVSELAVLNDVPGITEYHNRIQFLATVDLEGFAEPVNGLVVSLPDQRDDVINGIVMRQGDYFGDRRRNEAIISDKFARAHNIYPGQSIHVLLNNRRQELIVVGTAISSEFTYLVGPGSLLPDPKHFGVCYVKRTFAEDVFDFEGAANQIVGRLTPEARPRMDEVLRQIEDRLESYGVFETTKLEFQVSNQFLTNEIDGLRDIATVLPVIFLAVAALVLNVLITRMARRQRVVVGTLKALGYSDGQLFLHFLLYGLSVGLCGGLLGSFLGYLSATGITSVYRWFFEFPSLPSRFYWHTHLTGMSVSVLCAVLGSLHGSRAILKLNPAEAMRPEPPREGGPILLERLLGRLWTRLSSTWRMAVRTLFRHRFRTATAVFAATMGAGLLVAGFMMNEAQSFLIEFQFFRSVRSDIEVAFENEQDRDALSEIRHLPGVDRAEPLLNVACTFVNEPRRRKGAVSGLAAGATLTVPYDRDGRRIPVPATGLVLTRRLAEVLQLSEGDRVVLVPVKGERRPVEVVVARIADSYMGLAAYADIEFLSRLVDESFAMNGAQITAHPDPQRTRQLYDELKNMPGIKSVQSRRAMIDNLVKTLLQNQYVFIGVLIGFAGVIFFGSIVNASMVNLAERQREVATLRALGYSQMDIGAIFLRETLLTNLPGAVLGMPVGYFLTWLTAVSYNNDLLRLPVVAAPWIWVTTLSLAIVFSLLAHGIVQWAIARMDFLEALKVQE